jgi:hypothetical protein
MLKMHVSQRVTALKVSPPAYNGQRELLFQPTGEQHQESDIDCAWECRRPFASKR